VTWNAAAPYCPESHKICAFAVPYLQGGPWLDVGCGMHKCFPSAIGVDSGQTFGLNTAADVRTDVADLSMFADGSMAAVFSSHTLEDFTREQTPAVLAEWARVIRPGGHMVLYLPSANLYPKMGEPGANPAHKQDIYPGEIEALLRAMAEAPDSKFGWDLLESEERGQDNEYSLFIVVRKTAAGWREMAWQRNPDGQKRALVIRYGGIGDMIQAASVLPGLKAQGFHVTFNASAKNAGVLEHDPHIDEWIIQGEGFVPNEQLGPYWDTLGTRYDRVVNLCESIERSLLVTPDRVEARYPHAARHALIGGVNYLAKTHDIAGVPHDFRPRFYATAFEELRATQERARCGAPVVLWAINGSSPHKTWPWTMEIVTALLRRTPVHVYLTADPGIGKVLQDAIIEKVAAVPGIDATRLHGVAGKWSVRQALAFAQVADCVVGPETGLLNAVCMDASVPKVLMLSHSSHENLSRDWKATTVLEAPADKAPCRPCHMLHHDWARCHQDAATNAALCAAGIAPARVFEAIALALGARKAA
jgi:ADP-heptose:LPS heptosyltransferase